MLYVDNDMEAGLRVFYSRIKNKQRVRDIEDVLRFLEGESGFNVGYFYVCHYKTVQTGTSPKHSVKDHQNDNPQRRRVYPIQVTKARDTAEGM